MADKKQSDDYISLPGIKDSVKTILRYMVRLDTFIFRSIRHHLAVFCITLLLGCTVAVSYYAIRPVQYTYTMMAEVNLLTKKTYVMLFDQLNSLVSTGSGKELTKEMELSPEVASHVVYFSVESLTGESLFNDTSSINRSLLKVSVKARRPIDSLSFLETAILNYINNRPYIKKAKEGEQRIYESKMAFVDNQLRKLDSLEELYNKFITNSKIGTNIYNNAFNPADAYKSASDLMIQRAELIRWNSRDTKAISLVDSFKAVGAPSSKSLTDLLILFSLVTVPLACIICCFLELRQKVINEKL